VDLVVCDGVCLFFENSTVCRKLVPFFIVFWLIRVFVGSDWSVVGFSGVAFGWFWFSVFGVPAGLFWGWWVVFLSIHGEFDSGSGRTLAACLTHASRATPHLRVGDGAANG